MLAAAFRRLATDWAYWSAGLPDLLLWRSVPRGKVGAQEGGGIGCGGGGGAPCGVIDLDDDGGGGGGEGDVSRVVVDVGDDGGDGGGGEGGGSGGASDAKSGSDGGGTTAAAGVAPAPVEALWVEVKSARDRLSPRQRDWLVALADAGAAVEVCWVVERVPRTRRARRRGSGGLSVAAGSGGEVGGEDGDAAAPDGGNDDEDDHLLAGAVGGDYDGIRLAAVFDVG